jgi:hypothetical protein
MQSIFKLTKTTEGETKGFVEVGVTVNPSNIESLDSTIRNFLREHKHIRAAYSDDSPFDMNLTGLEKHPDQPHRDDLGVCWFRTSDGEPYRIVMTIGNLDVNFELGDRIIIASNMLIIDTTARSSEKSARYIGYFVCPNEDN